MNYDEQFKALQKGIAELRAEVRQVKENIESIEKKNVFSNYRHDRVVFEGIPTYQSQ